jgi:Cu+-exporting ATPase
MFDKTGTVTEGRPAVSTIIPVGDASLSPDRVLAIAAAVEQTSEHPLAEAIVREARRRAITIPAAASFRAIPGQGSKAMVDDRSVLVGSMLFMSSHHLDIEPLKKVLGTVTDPTHSVVVVAVDKDIVAMITVTDPIKPTSRVAVATLRAEGVLTTLLSGDRASTAEAVAREVGIDNVIAGVLPEGKLDAIRVSQRNGRVVAMVGDGINDAPALAAADVGIAMGSGTGVALEAASVALVRNDLRSVADAIRLSRRTMRTIRQNLFWAFVYNLVGIPLAAAGLLNPVVAAAAMGLSSVSVVSNSLRLRFMSFS